MTTSSTQTETLLTQLADKMALIELMNGWMYRDIGNWQAVKNLFHPEGEIELSWYEGGIDGFIEGSKKLATSEVISKHFIGIPMMTIRGNKAVTETNAMVMNDNTSLGFGSNIQVRFIDMVEKRNGEWKILKRQVVYDMGTFSFPRGAVPIDTAVLDKFPRAYAPMAYGIGKTGVTIDRVFATRGSELEQKIQTEVMQWLNQT